MTRFSRSIFGGVVFVMGCAAGGVAHNYVSPANAAAPAAPGSRFAYYCFKDDGVDSIQNTANEIGKQGWELASSSLSGGADMSSPIWCFKRSW